MKKTVLLTFVILLLCFTGVSGQRKGPIDPTILGDILSWKMQHVEVMVLLVNKNLEENNFQWITLDNDVIGKGFMGFYEDEDGMYSYTFFIDSDTGLLKGMEYLNFVNEPNTLVPKMQTIFDAYGLGEAPSYSGSALNDKLERLDYAMTAVSDSTVCILGYKYAAENVKDYVYLSFWDRSYYN